MNTWYGVDEQHRRSLPVIGARYRQRLPDTYSNTRPVLKDVCFLLYKVLAYHFAPEYACSFLDHRTLHSDLCSVTKPKSNGW